MEKNLFTSDDWEQNGNLAYQFYNVELVVPIGDFSIGHKFDCAYMQYGEESTLTFYVHNEDGSIKEEYSFGLSLSVK